MLPILRCGHGNGAHKAVDFSGGQVDNLASWSPRNNNRVRIENSQLEAVSTICHEPLGCCEHDHLPADTIVACEHFRFERRDVLGSDLRYGPVAKYALNTF